MTRYASRLVNFCPPSVMDACLAFSSPQTMRARVDFPEPHGPRSAVIFPAGNNTWSILRTVFPWR